MNTTPVPIQPLWRVRKLVRFIRIYGPSRAIIKAAGRVRSPIPLFHGRSARSTGVAFVGCGQFAFSTLAYFLRKHACFVACYDIDEQARTGMAKAWRVRRCCGAFSDILDASDVELAYVASNHASHSSYAASLLKAGKDVYVEKPIATSRTQLQSLADAIVESKRRIFAGYNRPFSKAISRLRGYLPHPKGPMTLACFVSAHVLDSDHWYRNPAEGTRICGNVGHWLDLGVHLLCWRHLPDALVINIAYGDPAVPDDNIAISLTSDFGDLISIVVTSRCEPFDGIGEMINVQWDDTIAVIDDFRRLKVWRGATTHTYRFWPKDVGHRAAIQQPFRGPARTWDEVTDSTLLMLAIADMVRSGKTSSNFSFAEERRALHTAWGASTG